VKGRDGAVAAGVGVAACAVCCAGPVLAILGAVGLGTLAGVATFGVIGLLIALLAVPVLVGRRRSRCAPADPHPFPVDAPRLKNPAR
jgi:mercuric ion transport protein